MVYFRHVFFPKLPKLEETRIKNKRFYIEPAGAKLPSVTTVLSLLDEDGINKWKQRVGETKANAISNRALANGTAMHTLIENYLNNKVTENKENPVAQKLFTQLKPTLSRINNIRALELQLYSLNLNTAGRMDCLADFDKVLSIIDFKSAKAKKKDEWIQKYYLQATAYALMVEELTKTKVDQLVIMISAEDGTTETFIKQKEPFVERLNIIMEDYKFRLQYEIP